MNTERIEEGIVLFVALICGHFVLNYAPQDSFHYKGLILLCLIYLSITVIKWAVLLTKQETL